MGEYRAKSLATLSGFMSQLGPQDRVRLFAVDVKAVPLTTQFTSPQGAEVKAALAKLDAREPLGTTDLDAALNAAADRLPTRPMITDIAWSTSATA